VSPITNAPTIVKLGPTRVRVHVVGDGEPLLLLNGIGGNIEMWAPLVRELHGRQLIMFDFPGTGESSRSWLPPTMAHNAWLTRRIVRRLGFARVDVLGYSWGGFLAQQLAAQHPRTVKRLILAATSVGLGGVPASPRVAAELLTRRRYTSRDHFAAVAPRIYGGRFRTDTTVADREFDHRSTSPPSRFGYSSQLAAAMTFTAIPLLPLISAPTLIIGGDDDPIVPTPNAMLLALRIRHSTLRVIGGAGHLFLLDSPEEASGVINDFLG
jgi:pimeloyl-ACP methyl ester carboxylesterase